MDKAALLAALGFLASKVVEFLKYVRVKDVNAAVTLVSVWVAGVVVTVLGAHAAVLEGVVIPGTGVSLESLDGPSQVFLGMVLTSFVSFTYDLKKALDGSDSAKQPPLVR